MNAAKILAPSLLFATMLSGPGAFAQNAIVPTGGAGNPTILDRLQKLQDAVEALGISIGAIDTKVSGMQTTVTTLENRADASVRLSPPVFVGAAGAVICSISNVGSAAHKVRMELISGDLGTVRTTLLDNFSLQPGEATVASDPVNRGTWYCRFTAIDGTRSDVRALAQVIDTTGAAPPVVTPAD